MLVVTTCIITYASMAVQLELPYDTAIVPVITFSIKTAIFRNHPPGSSSASSPCSQCSPSCQRRLIFFILLLFSFSLFPYSLNIKSFYYPFCS